MLLFNGLYFGVHLIVEFLSQFEIDIDNVIIEHGLHGGDISQ